MSHARSEYDDFKALAPDAYDAVARAGPCRGESRPRQATARADQAARLADQRLRLLRAASHPAEREPRHVDRQAQPRRGLARGAAIFTARTRGAGVDRSADAARPDGVSDEVYAQASAEFSEKELAYLTSAIASINAWNRLGAAWRWTPPVRQKALDAVAR